LTWDPAKEKQTRRLHRTYDDLGRQDFGEGTIDWVLVPVKWGRLLRAHGCESEDLRELRPAAGMTTTYGEFAPPSFARRWPVEWIWTTRRRACTTAAARRTRRRRRPNPQSPRRHACRARISGRAPGCRVRLHPRSRTPGRRDAGTPASGARLRRARRSSSRTTARARAPSRSPIPCPTSPRRSRVAAWSRTTTRPS